MSLKPPTREEIIDSFMRDFEDLLRQHNAEFWVTEESFGEEPKRFAEVYFNGFWEVENFLRPAVKLRLPDWIDPSPSTWPPCR